MSGGTLIALAADEIVMCEHAVLGPVDPQLGERSAASILKVVRQKPIAEVDDETLILVDQAEKALNQMECEVGELLAKKKLTERLVHCEIGLKVGERFTHQLQTFLVG